MEILEQLQSWHWFVAGIILVMLDIFLLGGFLLGMALAAVAVALLLQLSPEMGWDWQLIYFGALSLIFTVAYLKFFRKVNEATDNPLLNDRAAQLIGRTFVLGEDLDGSGAHMLGDTRWTLQCRGTISGGTKVKVVGSEGMSLVVEAES